MWIVQIQWDQSCDFLYSDIDVIQNTAIYIHYGLCYFWKQHLSQHTNQNHCHNVVLIISDLLQSHDIGLIQEHWLFADHVRQMNSVNSDFLSVGVSGMESSVPLQGHPYGGCATLYMASFPWCPPTPSDSVLYSYQIKLATFYILSTHWLWYFILTWWVSLCSWWAWRFYTLRIRWQSPDCRRFQCWFWSCGHNTTQFLTFMSDYDLMAVDRHYPSTEFTYENLDGSANSWIDHILSSCLFAQLISSIVKLDLAHNLSDHHVLSSNLAHPHSPVQASPGIAWHKVTEFNLICFHNLTS